MLLIEDQESGLRKIYSSGLFELKSLKNSQNTREFTEMRIKLFENDNILEIANGFRHTLILTESGKLIGFGSNEYGQLGNGNTKRKNLPVQIELPQLLFNISNYHLSCGENNSILFYPIISSLEEDLIKLFERKEFCDISFKTRKWRNNQSS
ncbi:protein rcc2 [Anaeramoeba ignava]|uniref:Protein rcc2 n=1 Tax=Anaeramoeba ignava TaxID=1746090 RepID=A0A9Q0LR55_ANAIG|nr:protein rcc2 [Anaeramoeba ignava]